MTTTYDFATREAKVRAALADAFPESGLDTEEGFAGRIHVRIISRAFNGRSEREKQELVWDALHRKRNEGVLDDEDLLAVSVVLPYAWDELP